MPERLKRVRRQRTRPLQGVDSFQLFHHRLKPEQLALVVAGIACGIVIGIVCFSYGSKFYNSWREGRLLDKANAQLQQHDYGSAIQNARSALELHRDSLPAYLVLAEATEQQNSVETVAWRAQIERLLPEKLESHLNLATAALRFGQLDIARDALQRVAPADRDKPAYHVVAGWLARAEGDEISLEEHFAAAAKQDPTNDLFQYNLAVLQIKSHDDATAENARTTLKRLAQVPEYRAGALRGLLNEAIDHNNSAAAADLAQDLQMSPQVTFGDYLLCLNFYRKLDAKKFDALLEKVKAVAARNPGDLALLLAWMNDNGLAAEVLKWQEKLPADLTTHPPPAIAIAEAFTEVKNWSRLKRWTRSGSWDDSDYLRLAYQAYSARQARQSGADAEFNSLWRSAEKATNDDPSRDLTLARLAMKWNLFIEAEQLWLRAAKHPPIRREALDALARIYRNNNDLPNLYRTMQHLHETSPGDAEVAAGYARLALLLDQNTAEGHRVAKEAYDRNSNDVNCVITYAFSLYGLGRTAEGLSVLKTLPKEQLLDPHAAVYAAVLFIDDNQLDAAKPYLDAARHGTLFSEEKKLLDEAVSKSGLTDNPPNASPSPGGTTIPSKGATPAPDTKSSPKPAASAPSSPSSPSPASTPAP